jgi:hypothetical protein
VYRSTHSLPRHWLQLSGQHHAPAALIPEKEPLISHFNGGWVGPRTVLKGVEKRKISPVLGLELLPLGRPAVASRYTDSHFEEHIQIELTLYLFPSIHWLRRQRVWTWCFLKSLPPFNYSTMQWRYLGEWRYAPLIPNLDTRRRWVGRLSSILGMHPASSYEMLVTVFQTIRYHVSKDNGFHLSGSWISGTNWISFTLRRKSVYLCSK